MNQGSVRQCAVRHVASWQCRVRCRGFLNHARAGTGLDQRQRRGMSCQGWVGLVQARLVTAWKAAHAIGAVVASTRRGGIERKWRCV